MGWSDTVLIGNSLNIEMGEMPDLNYARDQILSCYKAMHMDNGVV